MLLRYCSHKNSIPSIVFSDLHMYKAVLIVPDIYTRGHLRELMNLLLLKMGFGNCFLVQVGDFF